MVHPVPAPVPIVAETIKSTKAGTRTQKLKLFILGKAISGAPIIIGIIQFPNPPIIVGITKKKIIRNACPVTTTLYN